MSKKNLTVYDATKEELIQYFFNPIDGGFKVAAPVDRFLLWLKKKRTDELLKSYEDAEEESQKALSEYLKYVKEANDEKDLDKKFEIYKKANEAYERYERMQKISDKQSKKLDVIWE